jgi:hypothetical protein
VSPVLRARSGSASALSICLLLAICLGPVLAFEPPAVRAAPDLPQKATQYWTVLLTEDFESDFPGITWKLSGNPTWGRKDYRPHGGSWSGYCAGGGSQGLDPPGPYSDNMKAWMTYGPFDLSDATAAELRFSYWTQLGAGDELFWGASKSGFLYWGDKEKGASAGWRQVIVGLDRLGPGYLGEPEVWIGFKFQSDATGNGEGAYLDDITLRVQRPPDLSVRAYLPLVTH